MDSMKVLQFQDSLNYYRKLLKELVYNQRVINTSYQNYLKANPYKKDRNELIEKREEYTNLIMAIIDMGIDGFNLKNLNKVIKK